MATFPDKSEIALLKAEAKRLLDAAGLGVVEWDDSLIFQSWKTLVLGGQARGGRFVLQRKRATKARFLESINALSEAKIKLAAVDGIKVPDILGFDLERRLVIMSQACGNTITDHLIDNFRLVGNFDELAPIFEKCADALATFHSFMSSDPNARVRLYLDFGPQNLFFDKLTGTLTLIDLPDIQMFGAAEEDLGPACLEWLRIGLRRPRLGFVRQLSLGRRLFLFRYSENHKSRPISLSIVHDSELRRLRALFDSAWHGFHKKMRGRQRARALAILAALTIMRLFLIPLQQRIERREWASRALA